MKIIQLADLTVSRKGTRLSHGKKTIQQTWNKKRRKSSWQKTMEIVRKSRRRLRRKSR